jgi:1-acyl-sn-glycerol-3-phosphate acyltransferase
MPRDGGPLRRLFLIWLRHVFFRWYCPLSVTGLDHLPKTPFLLCANHASHLDGVALAVASAKPAERIGIVAASDYFFDHRLRHALVRRLLPLLPIDRHSPRAGLTDASRHCRALLAAGGEAIIMFPAGSRAPQPDWPGFRRGAALLAGDLGIALVPAFIDGTDRALPRQSWWPRPTPIVIRFGPAIQPATDGNRRQCSIETTLRLQECLRTLRGKADG